ncbi:MAG: DNA polymerase IV [Nitrososphaerales archaeon]
MTIPFESANANPLKQGKFGRIIFHVDMDSFYASCELSLRPELKEKPFVVGADPKDGKGRGVVIACNYAARKLGIRSALPISKAWELCPGAVFVRPNFAFYWEVSKKVFALVRQFADTIEQVSIDEAYLDVTNCIAVLFDDYHSEELAIRKLASSIKNAIHYNHNITCSIGVSNSKIISKIATDMNKPKGLTIVPPETVRDFLAPLPVGKIPGVGKVTEGILATQFNVKTISDLRKTPLELLESKFGKTGAWLHDVSIGIDEREIVEQWDAVSLSGETTFEEDESNYSKVAKVLIEVAKDVHDRSQRENYLFKNVGIKVRFAGFETHTRSKSLKVPTNSFDVLSSECEKLLSGFYDSGKKVRLIGVKISGLEKATKDQLTLFEWGETAPREDG